MAVQRQEIMTAIGNRIRELRHRCAFSQEELALAGLDAMKGWMQELGVALDLRQLGVKEEMLEGIADGTFLLTGGYRTLTRQDVVEILRESLKGENA